MFKAQRARSLVSLVTTDWLKIIRASILRRCSALSLLPFQNTATALRFIHATARQPTGSYELLQQARSLSAVLPVPTAEQALPPLAPATPAPAPMQPAAFPGDSK